jgi:hypothetical protein
MAMLSYVFYYNIYGRIVYCVFNPANQKNAAHCFGRKCAYLKFLLPRIFSNNQNKQVSFKEKGAKMTV